MESLINKRITIQPDLCNGKPTVRGFRVTVKSILEHLAAGDSFEDILTAFPFLEKEDIYASLAFGALAVDHPVHTFKLAG